MNGKTLSIRGVLFIVTITIVFIPTISFAGNGASFRNEINAGFNALYNFKFKEADSIVIEIKKKYPNNAETYLYAANVNWWKIITGENPPYQAREYQNNLATAFSKVNKIPESKLSQQDLYCIISFYSGKARYDAMNKNYIKALSNINSCVNMIKKSFGKEKDYPPFYLTSGLFNYMVHQTRIKHPYLFPYTVFLPSGNKQTGLNMLGVGVNSTDPLVRTESIYFLLKINLEEEKNYDKAIYYGKILVDQFPQNLIYRYYYYQSLLINKNPEEATFQLKELKKFALQNDDLSAIQRDYLIKVCTNK